MGCWICRAMRTTIVLLLVLCFSSYLCLASQGDWTVLYSSTTGEIIGWYSGIGATSKNSAVLSIVMSASVPKPTSVGLIFLEYVGSDKALHKRSVAAIDAST